MSTINSLESLVNKLNESNPENYAKLAKGMSLPIEDFKKYEYWSSEKYTRNCIARNEHFELMLLCWEPGQQTPIHGHGGQRCWVYQVDGDIFEVRYSKNNQNELNKLDELNLKAGEISYMDDEMGFHYLKNPSQKSRAMTLHLYMLPIDNCKIYNTETSNFETKELFYDTFKGEHIGVAK